jgi:hypothetical protein
LRCGPGAVCIEVNSRAEERCRIIARVRPIRPRARVFIRLAEHGCGLLALRLRPDVISVRAFGCVLSAQKVRSTCSAVALTWCRSLCIRPRPSRVGARPGSTRRPGGWRGFCCCCDRRQCRYTNQTRGRPHGDQIIRNNYRRCASSTAHATRNELPMT